MIRVFFGVPESYGNSPGSIWALLGFRGKREERFGAPQGLVRIGLEGGAAPPPSLSSLLPFLDSYSYYLEGGNPTPGGSTTPPWRAFSWPAAPSPLILYIRGQGAPLDTTTIDPLDLLAVCCAPSTIIHLDNIVAVLRRSPASVASSTQSSHHRADGTLRQSSAGSEFVGRH